MARNTKKKTADLKVVGGHGEIGHNSAGAGQEMSDEQEQALFLRHKAKIAALLEKQQTALSNLRNAYKEAKGDGFTKREFELAFALEKDDDNKLVQQRRRETTIARWLNHPLGTQADLFSDDKMVDRRPLKERAYDEGKVAGMEGRECKPPYQEGEAYEGWVEGWHVGVAASKNQADELEEGGNLLRDVGKPKSAPDEFDEAAGEDAAEFVNEDSGPAGDDPVNEAEAAVEVEGADPAETDGPPEDDGGGEGDDIPEVVESETDAAREEPEEL